MRPIMLSLTLVLLASSQMATLSNCRAEDTHKPENPASAGNTQNTAFNQVKTTIDEVVRIVQANQGKLNQEKRRKELRTLLDGRFDFQEMSQRSLGTYWPKVTEAERSEFVTLFSELLARTYLAKIETIEPGMVKIDNERLDYPRSIVKTIVKNKGDTFPIDYRLLFEDGRWKVFDVIIENIGLVANYRNEFAGIIRRNQMSGLLEKLRTKNAAAA